MNIISESVASNEVNKISRRKIISGLGAGLAAAVVAHVLSAKASPHVENQMRGKLEDRAGKYPKPPF